MWRPASDRCAARAGRPAAGPPARGHPRRSTLAWWRPDHITMEKQRHQPVHREIAMPGLNVPMYDPRLVQPMREELTRIGFQELRTPTEVDQVLGTTRDTTLVVVNSVCGCAARNARPAATLALQHARRPKRLLTVFAGQDADAT